MIELGFLQPASRTKIDPNPRKIILLREKVAQTPPFMKLISLGLGWPWVGEFVGFQSNTSMFSNPTDLILEYIANNVLFGVR